MIFWKPNTIKNNVFFEVIQTFEGLLLDCFKKEQNILKTFDNFRINTNFEFLKSTETFSHDILEKDLIENY